MDYININNNNNINITKILYIFFSKFIKIKTKLKIILQFIIKIINMKFVFR